MATPTSESIFKESDEIDRQRREADFLLELIVGGSQELDEIVGLVVTELRSKYKNMSQRLSSLLDTIVTSDINDYGMRVLKHGLLFFALANEPWAIDIITTRGRIPPKRYELFFKSSLVPKSQNLLNGVLTSLWAYVEQVRGDYIIS